MGFVPGVVRWNSKGHSSTYLHKDIYTDILEDEYMMTEYLFLGQLSL